MSFTSRTEAPAGTEQWWQASWSPCLVGNTSKSKELNSTLPGSAGYAFGRFAEIMGEYPTGLPNTDSSRWYDDDTTHEKSTDPYSPRLGAVAVWASTKEGAGGHLGIVESITRNDNGDVQFITTSESDWEASWGGRWWQKKRYPPNYSTGGYTFKGFIYNPAVSESESAGNAGELSLDNPNHPAQIFIKEAISHAGDGGHAWVQSMVPIGNQAWCAATMCAVGKACGYNGVIMPDNDFTASGFGQRIIEEYGGQYLRGPMMGGSDMPQVGDIFECFKGYATSGTYGSGDYRSYHVGAIRGVEGNTLLTVEGNHSGTYALAERDYNSGVIGWFARPDWSKVGGAMTGTAGGAGFQGGKLYTTQSTNADASIREVGYLDEDGKPSISPTGVKLSVINYTTLLGAFVSIFGGSGSGGSGDNVDGIEPPQARECAEYFLRKGLNTAAAVGIIANIKRESGFNTAAVGDHGTSFGICQWHNERGTAMKQLAGSNWASNLTGQLDYLWTELEGGYNTGVLVPLQGVENTEAGALSATEIWCRHFEIPADIDNEVILRQGYAKEYWASIIVTPSSNTEGAAQQNPYNQDGTPFTEGTRIDIPSSVNQSGITSSFTYYIRNWTENTTQHTLYKLWEKNGSQRSYNIATLNGYYLIAVAPTFGSPGDLVTVTLEDGTYFNAIVGDAKNTSDARYTKWGHRFGSGAIDVIEWETTTSTQSEVNDGLKQAGWFGKRVSNITWYGSWLTGART